MEPVALTLAAAALLFVLLRRPGVFSPALVSADALVGTVRLPGDDDEQLPETDRAPSAPRALVYAVAALALLRVAAFAALGA